MLPHEGARFSEMARVARHAEDCGFDQVWLDDHFLPILFDERPDYLEAWTALSALASTTERIRLGTMVSCVTYRNPAYLAKVAATLDQISNGRAEFGVGAGWSEREHRGYGYEFPPLSVRSEIMEESIEIAIALWTQEEVTFAGKHFQLDRGFCAPKPVQKPYPPIWVGGGGERRTLPIAARLADWSNFGALLPDVPRKVEVLREHAEKAGRAAPGASLFVRMFCAPGAKGDEYRRRGEGRPNIAGTPQDCAEQMAAFVDAGIRNFCFLELERPERMDATIEALGLLRAGL